MFEEVPEKDFQRENVWICVNMGKGMNAQQITGTKEGGNVQIGYING